MQRRKQKSCRYHALAALSMGAILRPLHRTIPLRLHYWSFAVDGTPNVALYSPTKISTMLEVCSSSRARCVTVVTKLLRRRRVPIKRRLLFQAGVKLSGYILYIPSRLSRLYTTIDANMSRCKRFATSRGYHVCDCAMKNVLDWWTRAADEVRQKCGRHNDLPHIRCPDGAAVTNRTQLQPRSLALQSSRCTSPASIDHDYLATMRLLQIEDAQKVSFTGDLSTDRIPPYAILSHRWGPDGDEVKFADVMNNTATDKPGYAKISFCIRQARRDGIRHFWIDTCSIDKSNNTELSEAINSMFRW
nr:vegetative incompatibility protein het-e-1 [Quercus suber]